MTECEAAAGKCLSSVLFFQLRQRSQRSRSSETAEDEEEEEEAKQKDEQTHTVLRNRGRLGEVSEKLHSGEGT